MAETRKGKGSCLCGAVTFETESMNPSLMACHCDMCRKWTGGPLMAVGCGSDVRFGGREHMGVYDSSPWADRGFCKKCGSGLFYRLKSEQTYYLPVGLFENPEGIVFEEQVYIDKKPDYYAFVNETRNLTGAEVVAIHSGSQEG